MNHPTPAHPANAAPVTSGRAPVLPGKEPVSPALETCDRIYRRSLRAAIMAIIICFGIVGGWMAIARLDSAVVAPGVLENADTTRLIQHLEGGIVREIFVRNGDRVKAGDLLLRLDPTESEATTALFDTQILGNRAQLERLEAELAMAEELVLSQELLDGLAQWPQLAKVQADEMRRFELQRQELVQARDLLRTKIAQAEEEIRANEIRRSIAEREAVLVNADLANKKILRERGLSNQAQVTELEQTSLALEEKVAQSDIEIARIRQSILGLQLEITQREQEYRAKAAADLETLKREVRELERNAIVSRASLSRVEIRSPVDGTVQESILGTIGAVIQGGAVIMKIAPDENDYIIVARVSPNDIDGLVPGEAALITFPAFQSLELPPAEGELISLSRDRVTDAYTREYYYEARVRLDEMSLPEYPRQRLVAGMSTTTILPTGERTALNYLIGPLLRQLQTAMREE